MERKARRIGTIAGRTSENHQLFGMKSNITDAKIAMGQSCKCVSNARGGWGGGGRGNVVMNFNQISIGAVILLVIIWINAFASGIMLVI